MDMWNVYVVEDEHGLMFEDGFQMNDFSIHFDCEDETHGMINFTPETRKAICFHYNSYEDLSACYDTFDLYDSEAGRDVWEAFHRYDLGGVYRAAKRFTIQYLEKKGL